MKLVKQYKSFKIKQITERDRAWGRTSEYYIFNRDNDEEWETDSLEEAMEWIDCY